RRGYVRVLSSMGTIVHTLTSPEGKRTFGLSLGAFPDIDGDGVGELLIGQPFAAQDASPITIWSLKEGKLLRTLAVPEPDAWDGGLVRRDVGDSSTALCESFGTRLMALTDRDGDAKPDVMATLPQSFCFVPAGVLSSATARMLGHVELGWGDYSHVGNALCKI